MRTSSIVGVLTAFALAGTAAAQQGPRPAPITGKISSVAPGEDISAFAAPGPDQKLTATFITISGAGK